MKYYLIAGEQSGDLHASNLVKTLRHQDAAASFRAVGGDLLKAANVDLAFHYKEMAVMGLVEVLRKLGTLKKYLAMCKSDIADFEPDVIIPVDFAGFNLRIARFSKALGIKVFYYISPKIWAWNESRIWKIKKYVDRMFVILPFEPEFYKKYDFLVNYVGNPVVDAVRNHKPDAQFLDRFKEYPQPLIAILPGSRMQEVAKMLPVMLEVAGQMSNYTFIIAGVKTLSRELYPTAEHIPDNVELFFDKTYDILAVSRAAIVTSGTATLETALWNVPQVMGYMTHPVTYLIGRPLVKIDMFSLVNLIMGKPLISELIQKNFNVQKVLSETLALLEDGPKRQDMLSGYSEMQEKLGTGSASDKTADLMIEYLKA